MQREVPSVLWVGLIALGLISIVQFLIGVSQGNVALLIGVALSLIFLFGLYRGHRWAFVLTLVLGTLGVIGTMARSPAAGFFTLVANGFVLVPVILAKDYFWSRQARSRKNPPNYCARCGHSLHGVSTPYCPNCGIEARAADSQRFA